MTSTPRKTRSNPAKSPAINSAEAGGPTGVRLRRSFRMGDSVALIVSSVIAAGIFTTPAFIAMLVPEAKAMVALWIVGGGLALAGALSYARLGWMWPWAGGEYIHLSKAYGPTASAVGL